MKLSQPATLLPDEVATLIDLAKLGHGRTWSSMRAFSAIIPDITDEESWREIVWPLRDYIEFRHFGTQWDEWTWRFTGDGLELVSGAQP